MNGPEVLIYTAPGCPDCAALKDWFRQRAIGFEERDVSAPGVAEKAKSRYGVRVAPVVVLRDGTVLYGTFEDQKPKLEAAFVARD